MGKRELNAKGAPHRSPGPEREQYLPEDDYFVGEFPIDPYFALKVTAHRVSTWADRYIAYPSTEPGKRREGLMPASDQMRGELLRDIFVWFEAQVPWYQSALNLFEDDQALLDQHDGAPGILALRPEEYAELQDAWDAHELPRDLYYAPGDQRTAVEPEAVYGALVRVQRRYSPRRWARRDH